MMKHYVYVHKEPNGKIFYVGKGVGDRAKSKDRLEIWHHYVKTRCAGQFVSEIIRYFDDEEQALAFEDKLIAQYGPQLVNWINTGRDCDYKTTDLFWSLREANWAFIAETRSLEEERLVEAIERYRQAIRNIAQYAHLVLERGLVAELMAELSDRWNCHVNGTDLKALDRLTLLLKKEGRSDELIQEVDAFFLMYPSAASQGLAKTILSRRDRVDLSKQS